MKIKTFTSNFFETEFSDCLESIYLNIKKFIVELERDKRKGFFLIYAKEENEYLKYDQLNSIFENIDELIPEGVQALTTSCNNRPWSYNGLDEEFSDVLITYFYDFGIMDSFSVEVCSHECDIKERLSEMSEKANRKYEAPSVIWMHSTPGNEEMILKNIRNVLGDSVVVCGGSASDQSVEGKWKISIYQNKKYKECRECNILIGFYMEEAPINRLGGAHYSIGGLGKITKCDKRRIYEIEGRPAVDVYTEKYTSDELNSIMRSVDDASVVLAPTTLHPIGKESTSRKSSHDSRYPYIVSHPALFHADKSMSLFTDFSEGDYIFALKGSDEIIENGVSDLFRQSLVDNNITQDEVSFVMLSFCAGIRMYSEEIVKNALKKLKSTLGDSSCILHFSFGEQGVIEDQSQHGNLMISMLIFKKDHSAA